VSVLPFKALLVELKCNSLNLYVYEQTLVNAGKNMQLQKITWFRVTGYFFFVQNPSSERYK